MEWVDNGCELGLLREVKSKLEELDWIDQWTLTPKVGRDAFMKKAKSLLRRADIKDWEQWRIREEKRIPASRKDKWGMEGYTKEGGKWVPHWSALRLNVSTINRTGSAVDSGRDCRFCKVEGMRETTSHVLGWCSALRR